MRARECKLKRDLDAIAEREKTLKAEIEVKRQKLDESGQEISDLDFQSSEQDSVEASNEKGKQTKDFDYLVMQPTGRPPVQSV